MVGSGWRLLALTVLLGASVVGVTDAAPAGSAGWVTHGPYGGRILNIVADPRNPNVVYVSSIDGPQIYRSTDGGATWERSDDGLSASFCFVQSLAIDPVEPETLFAGTCDFGMFRSNDAGRTWTSVGDSWPELIWSLAFDPRQHTTVYAGTDAGIFRSTDGGDSWIRLEGSPGAFSIAIDPVHTGTIYAGTYSAVLRSEDGGATWTRLHGGFHTREVVRDLVLDPAAPGTIYASAGRKGVFRSEDGGRTWERRSEGIAGRHPKVSVGALAIDPSDPQVLYAGSDAGIFRSTDRARTWLELDTGRGLVVDDLTIAAGEPQEVLAGTESGVYVTRDGGARWSDSNTGILGRTVSNVVVGAGSDVWASDGAVYVSRDAGARWRGTDLKGGIYSMAFDARRRIVYAGGTSGLFTSIDGGRHWERAGLDHHAIAEIALDPAAVDTIYVAAAFRGVFRSLDGGRSWRHVGLERKARLTSLVVDPADPRILLAGTGKGILRSSDGGFRWDHVADYVGVNDLTFDDAGVGWAATDRGVRTSFDGGETWSVRGLRASAVSTLALDPTTRGRLFASTWRTVSVSDDRGRTWRSLQRFGAGRYVTALAVARDGAELYVGVYPVGVVEVPI